MWYSGHDDTTGRILAAAQPPGGAWERLGVAIDAGFAGDSDQYAVESPCVVHTPGGYLMAYAGFDGEATRLHMATSDDGRGWAAQGTIMQRAPDEALGASHPCLIGTQAGWWLFFCGYDGSRDSRRAAILAAVSPTGASSDRVGVVLAPVTGELAVSHPCVIQVARTFYMFHASDDGDQVSIAMATSADGCSWDRHGTTLAASEQGAEAAACTACASSGSRTGRCECGTRRSPAGTANSPTGSARPASRAPANVNRCPVRPRVAWCSASDRNPNPLESRSPLTLDRDAWIQLQASPRSWSRAWGTSAAHQGRCPTSRSEPLIPRSNGSPTRSSTG